MTKNFLLYRNKKFTKKIFSKNRGWKNIFLLYAKVYYAIHMILKNKKTKRKKLSDNSDNKCCTHILNNEKIVKIHSISNA